MGYQSAPATRMLATRCICCNRALLDSESIEYGIGPVCRKKYGFFDHVPNREAANALVHQAAIAAQNNDVSEVLRLADEIDAMGLDVLAAKIRERFIEIRLVENVPGEVEVYIPFCQEFIDVLRANIPRRGKRMVKNANDKFKCWVIKREFQRDLFDALKAGFPGRYALGPKGVFQIPEPQPQQDTGPLARRLSESWS